MNRGFGAFGPAGGGEDESTNQLSGGVTNAAGIDVENSGGEDDTNRTANFRGRFGRGANDSFNFTNRPGRFGTNRFRGGRFGRGGFGGPRLVEWQNDAKYYEFWVRGDAKGHFTIPNVRAGTYTLHAIADGVLGEFTLTNVTVAAGQKLDLGKLNWQPVRHGRQLWDIGIPNRTAAEFFKGDDYYHWGWYLEYAKLFPNDVNYVVGKSDFRKDWFFEQVPHNEDPEQHQRPRPWPRARPGRSPSICPTRRAGRRRCGWPFAASAPATSAASVNDQSIGSVTNLVYNATINRDGIGGYWSEHDLAFDASLMKAGENVMKLTVPAGSLTSGIIYDYLRLELDEAAAPPKSEIRIGAVAPNRPQFG